jgi:hypothetical protein
MSGELDTAGEGLVERSIVKTWERLAPLSAGAVAGAAVLVGSSAVLRRLLGSRRSVLNWTAMAVLLPIGLWLMAGTKGVEAEPGFATGMPELDEGGTTITPEA